MDFAEITPAIALGPLDGRYRSAVAPLVNYLSEPALNRARITIEVEWLIFVSRESIIPNAPVISADDAAYLRSIPRAFDAAGIAELAELEAATRHDVKAVEYFVKRRLDERGTLSHLHEMVHIFCTSEDINNLAYALSIRDALVEVWLPQAQHLVETLTSQAHEYADIAMLARTHGQPATPTTLGKEIAVFAARLGRQLRRIRATEYLGKLNGATGTFGAHYAGVPTANWPELSRRFVTGLGLEWNPLTTQIEPHDWQVDLYNDLAHFNRIAHNAATDFWTYISLGYFQQDVSTHGSTGSSTMPHKVNPIKFENAEANFEISSALFDSLASTLVTSRLQRDLTDSSTQRNIGVAIGHSLLAISNLTQGLAGVSADRPRIGVDLENSWEVLAEPIQQAMRTASLAGATGLDEPYERLKELTRGAAVDQEKIRTFVTELGLPPELQAQLLALSPASYVGVAAQLVEYLEARP